MDFEAEVAQLITELDTVHAQLSAMERRLAGFPALWERFAAQHHAAVWEPNARPEDGTSGRIDSARHRVLRIERRAD